MHIKNRQSNNIETSIAAGHCKEHGNIIPISEEFVIKPDCNKSQYGCLFCENYVCHADAEDIEKLFSLIFVIDSVRNISPNLDRVEELFNPIETRARFILNKMKELSNSVENLVQRIEHKVMVLGILTPFWELKLQRLEDLGIKL